MQKGFFHIRDSELDTTGVVSKLSRGLEAFELLLCFGLTCIGSVGFAPLSRVSRSTVGLTPESLREEIALHHHCNSYSYATELTTSSTVVDAVVEIQHPLLRYLVLSPETDRTN
jgi:hypothetical protein